MGRVADSRTTGGHFPIITGLVIAVALSASSIGHADTGEPCVGPEPCEVYVDAGFTSDTPGWAVDHFAQIGTAIAAVGSGGTVYVAAGTYAEYLDIAKPLTLEGVDRDTTFIHGGSTGGFGGVVQLQADGIVVRGFTIRNLGASEVAGMYLTADHCTVEDNLIRDNVFGIHLLHGSQNRVAHNIVRFNASDGILFEGLSHENLIERNLLEYNGNIGCHIKDDADRNVVRDNRSVGNEYRGVPERVPGTDNYIYRNSLIDNVDQDANDDGVDFWGRDYPAGGNYYSDYDGQDLFHGPNQDLPGSDGIGDTPYLIHTDYSGANVDHYPLIEPYLLDPEEPDRLPAPSGPSQGAPGQSYEFEVTVGSSVESPIEIRWYWGEDEFSDWSGPIFGGDVLVATYTWLAAGNYAVRVQARDIATGTMEDWSAATRVGIGEWGDASGDLVVDIADVIYVLEYLFGDGPEPTPLFTADVNGDDSLDLSDPIALLDYLF